MAGLAKLLLLLHFLAAASESCSDVQGAACSSDDILAGVPAEQEEALHLLQRRSAKLQEQEHSGPPPAAEANASHPGRRHTKHKYDINWDSSKHGKGPIWRHWKKLNRACNTTGITRRCRRAMVGMANSIFKLLQRKEGHTYTDEEKRAFRHRFTAYLKENTAMQLQVTGILHDYDEWKEALFKFYELMRPAVTKQFVDMINAEKLGWEAHYRESMHADSVMHVMSLNGLELSDKEAEALFQETKDAEKEDLLEIEKVAGAGKHGFDFAFDARMRWPECGNVLRHVRYQDCANCWSHATALVAESRICIGTHGRLNGRDAWLSQSYVALCRADGRDYCAGGGGGLGFSTINALGVPTGAPNSRGNARWGVQTCVPQVEPHLRGLRCPAACTDRSYPRQLESDLFYPKFSPRSMSPRGGQAYEMAKVSILQEGPILFGMTAYADFYAYIRGVYSPSRLASNRNMGGHAVTGMGFGPGYFLCVNSWGADWGEGGAFKARPEALDIVIVLPGYVWDSQYPTPVP